ncbi:hypothetical protein AAVH_25143 [Aphelenchoides avenae]|nr:hypothetical protein AAVH_25143 [Aphelenchus avenae]
MHPVLFNESFFFCPRVDLESLQLVRRSLLNMIVAGSNVLSLLPVYRVNMDCDDAGAKIQIYVDEDAYEPGYEASVYEGDFPKTFRCLQNICVKEFIVGIRDSPFLRYWKAQEAAVFTVVSIDFDLTDDTDYDVLDSIVNHLRPRTTEDIHVRESSWRENGHNSKRLKLLARESFLNNLQTCCLNVFENAFPAPAFFLKESSYSNYELECNRGQVAAGIERFIESFVRDGCANEKLESVCITWTDPEDRQSPAPKQLSKPTKIGMLLPENGLTEWLIPFVHRVSQCEMQSFVNTKQWKRMEVFEWSAEYYPDRSLCTTHLLQCLVKNL